MIAATASLTTSSAEMIQCRAAVALGTVATVSLTVALDILSLRHARPCPACGAEAPSARRSPGIRVLAAKTWMAGTGPAITSRVARADFISCLSAVPLRLRRADRVHHRL